MKHAQFSRILEIRRNKKDCQLAELKKQLYQLNQYQKQVKSCTFVRNITQRNGNQFTRFVRCQNPGNQREAGGRLSKQTDGEEWLLAGRTGKGRDRLLLPLVVPDPICFSLPPPPVLGRTTFFPPTYCSFRYQGHGQPRVCVRRLQASPIPGLTRFFELSTFYSIFLGLIIMSY